MNAVVVLLDPAASRRAQCFAVASTSATSVAWAVLKRNGEEEGAALVCRSCFCWEKAAVLVVLVVGGTKLGNDADGGADDVGESRSIPSPSLIL